MGKPKTWVQQRADVIRKDAKARYGAGWALLSQDQQENYLLTQVLNLLLSQHLDQFKPAQDMARGVMRELLPYE